MDIEGRLIRAHVELHVRPKDGRDPTFVSVMRCGAYEVRLVEPAPGSPDAFVFRLELFDNNRGLSLDSGSAEDFEEALTIAEELVSQAEQLSKRSNN
jgi:hypothetical protein